MPDLINANPTVLAASAIPSRALKSSPDPFQDLLTSKSAPEEWDESPESESFDAQEIYGAFPLATPSNSRLTEYYL